MSNKSLPIQTYDKRPQMPRAIELPTPIYGYTGEKRKEIIKGPKEDRLQRPIDQRIVGYTGYVKPVSEEVKPVKYSEHKLRGYAGFVPRMEREEAMLVKPERTGTQPNPPGYTGYVPGKVNSNLPFQTYGNMTKNKVDEGPNMYMTTNQAVAQHNYGIKPVSLVQVRREMQEAEEQKERDKIPGKDEKAIRDLMLIHKSTFKEAKELYEVEVERRKIAEINVNNGNLPKVVPNSFGGISGLSSE